MNMEDDIDTYQEARAHQSHSTSQTHITSYYQISVVRPSIVPEVNIGFTPQMYLTHPYTFFLLISMLYECKTMNFTVTVFFYSVDTCKNN